VLVATPISGEVELVAVETAAGLSDAVEVGAAETLSF
jgi:hypothetical protein